MAAIWIRGLWLLGQGISGACDDVREVLEREVASGRAMPPSCQKGFPAVYWMPKCVGLSIVPKTSMPCGEVPGSGSSFCNRIGGVFQVFGRLLAEIEIAAIRVSIELNAKLIEHEKLQMYPNHPSMHLPNLVTHLIFCIFNAAGYLFISAYFYSTFP